MSEDMQTVIPKILKRLSGYNTLFTKIEPDEKITRQMIAKGVVDFTFALISELKAAKLEPKTEAEKGKFIQNIMTEIQANSMGGKWLTHSDIQLALNELVTIEKGPKKDVRETIERISKTIK